MPPSLTDTDTTDTSTDTPSSFEEQLGAAVETQAARLQESIAYRFPPAPDEPFVQEDPSSDVPPGSADEAPPSGTADDDPDQPSVDGSTDATPDQPSHPAPEDALAPEGAGAGDLPPPPPDAQPVVEEQPVVSKFAVPLDDGTTVDLDIGQVKSLLSLSGWAQALPDDTRHQFAAIESGHAVAIPREEWDQYQTWMESRGRTRDGQQPATQLPAGIDADDLTPEAQEYLLRVQQENEYLRNRPDPQAVAASQQDLHGRVQTFQTAVGEWGDEHKLPPEDTHRLFESAVQSGVVQTLVNTGRQHNPITGAILREADLGTVARKAMDFALTQDPDLHNRVIWATFDHPDNPSSSPSSSTAPSPSPSQADSKVSQKKARSSSLASAPSASVPQSPTDPTKMTSDQRLAAMAQAIAASDGS